MRLAALVALILALAAAPADARPGIGPRGGPRVSRARVVRRPTAAVRHRPPAVIRPLRQLGRLLFR